VIVPTNVPSTMYSRDHGELVSGATGSRDSFAAETDSTQPSGEVRVPGAADGTGATGTAGTGAGLATGAITGSGGGTAGSAAAWGLAAAKISRLVPAKAVKR
jgi:hypothetical protein